MPSETEHGAPKNVFGRTFSDLDKIAKEGVRRELKRLHAQGIATYHQDEGGQMYETSPDGETRPLSGVVQRR